MSAAKAAGGTIMPDLIVGGVRRYPAYRDSGVEWIGSVPSGWAIKPLKRVATLRTQRADERIFAVALENIESWSGRFIEADGTYEGEGTAFAAGDILFGKLRPYLAKAWLADKSGEAVGDFHVLRCSPSSWPAFFQKVILSGEIISLIDGSTFGAKMPRASWDFMGMLPVPVPPPAEQSAIATFLDRETGKIDALVAEQERLMALLKEKRQTVISQAVTKGLDLNAPMKDSDVEWIGTIPQHWDIKGLSRVIRNGTSITYGIVQAGPDIEGGIPYIRTSDMNGEVLPETGYLRTSHEIAQAYERSSVAEGDLVVAIRATVGKTLPVPARLDGANLTQGTAKISPGKKITMQFLYYLLNSVGASQAFEAISKGATFKEITLDALRKFRIAVPPLTEQRGITAFLDIEAGRFDTLIYEANRAIALLRERRAALISAAVTGKIDVRGLVATQREAA